MGDLIFSDWVDNFSLATRKNEQTRIDARKKKGNKMVELES